MQSKPLKNEFEFDVPKMGTLVTPGTEMCPPMRWPSGYGVRLAIGKSLVRIQLSVVPFTPIVVQMLLLVRDNIPLARGKVLESNL